MKTCGASSVRVALLFVLLFGATVALAQTYPEKQIRIVVPFPPGGGIDTLARILGEKFSQTFGQQVIVDNRTGASGTIGTDIVAKAPADGHTLLATFSSHASNAALYTKLPFDTLRDFAPITLILTVPNLLVVNPSLPVKDLKEMIALAKRRPGELLYASIGSGSPQHLAAELFNMMAGTKMTHVPYKGGPPSMVAVVSGESQLTFQTVLIALPHVENGRLRALAVASPKRSAVIPNIPTIGEAGLPGYEAASWYALLAPARTPPSVIEKLHREAARTLQLPEVRKNVLAQGAEPVGSTPEQLDAVIRSDIQKWSKVVKAAGIKVD